jgi:preprotein translocase subunit SecA
MWRDLRVGDGCYAEREEQPVLEIEEWLRALMVRFRFGSRWGAERFLRLANAAEADTQRKDDDVLRFDLGAIARQMQRHGFRDDLLGEAFAIVREAGNRTLGKRHYDVQLLAGRALLHGQLAEMATGEGKTLAATLAVCTAAATGVAVHVVTVNDYLAQRDAEENRPLYEFFGFSVGVVVQDMPVESRREQYARQIAYVSNKELTFDYLKDRIALGGTLAAHVKLRALQGTRQAPSSILRGLHFALVDEADSVLIDEARTPLIISETLPDDLGEAVYGTAIALAAQLQEGADYRLGKDRDAWLTTQGSTRVEALVAGMPGVWTSALWRKELMQKALSALYLFHRDQHYIVVEGKVQIVDEFTGRVMPDRTWERGLHQMIESKEQCEISGQRRTLSQITYQRFFGRYLLLAGMTGTAKEVEPEIKRVYDLAVAKIPTHRPIRRRRLPDRVFRTSNERWQEVARRACEIAAAGRAVLIGTRSVEASETLGRLLQAQGVAHTLLNARQDKAEAETVGDAGQVGRITVATNMAGRGTDIKLAAEVAEQGGLHVILTEFHESARVDRQLFGRSGRQGDPGTVEAIVCLEDELFLRYAPLATRIGTHIWVRSGERLQLLFRGLIFLLRPRLSVKQEKFGLIR